MGWETSTRRSRLPRDWPALSKRVLSLYDHTCAKCGARATDVDHIEPGDDHSLKNLQALCRDCHKAKTAAEGHEANRRRWAELKAITKRPQERHPGTLKRPAKPLPRRGW